MPAPVAPSTLDSVARSARFLSLVMEAACPERDARRGQRSASIAHGRVAAALAALAAVGQNASSITDDRALRLRHFFRSVPPAGGRAASCRA